MISSFQLKFGRSPGATAEAISATPVTVFVGPNNSGKSRVLREVERYCRTGQNDANDLLLAELTFAGLTSDRTAQSIERIRQPPHPGEAQHVDHIFVGSKYGRQQVPVASLQQFLQTPTSNVSAFCQWYLKHLTLMLDGSSRIGLVGQQGAGDLQRPPESSFQVLFRDDAKRHEVRRIVFDAFGRHFVLDPTNLGQLRIRLSDRAPRDDMEERGIHADAVRFHASAQVIDEASDGVKAFTGIITEVMAGDPSVVLVDEPEAFLHPSLASKLAQEVARAALSADKRVFVSTHSPQFVMGCIQSGAPVNIIRLTYRGGVATARILPSDEILELMRHPLLRSTGLLSGLFYEFVVVTESDADRAFYQEINERLLQFKPEWGIPNCLFLNAQNKQTVQTLLRPLRKLGIPAAGVVDVDVLKDGGSNWTNLLSSADVPQLSHGSFATLRVAVKNAMDATGKDMKRDGGLAILSGADRQAAEDLLNQLRQYGIFAIPGGELESWMKGLGASGHGPTWLIDVFERMGEDPSNANYVRPNAGDVWEFVRDIRSWLVDPARKGIPA
ncbi:ATP-dependent endonuclease [Duganella sp. Root1480D1]|uniref:ATP-dependent nuclease n=1 Tax=Duganella sp. Root1480D1 TaxID=1736471 RepID=UPI00070F96B4|nr:AAA family ATPase [Duganella sp. Root1480D1]KQZ42235.1 ATPase [Duganella sp. Root1480D1]